MKKFETVESITEDCRRAVAAARMAAGEPWRDDSDKDAAWLAREAEAIRDRTMARIAYAQWKRRHRLTWRWRTYPGVNPEEKQ